MTALLLDTHVIVWWATANARLHSSWAEPIAAPENRVYMSAASVWEIEIKKRADKLAFEFDVLDLTDEYGFEPMEISPQDAAAAGALDWEHRDPFDRMLVAQAMRRNLTLVSADDAVRAAPGIRVL